MKQRFSSLDVKVSLWKTSLNFHGGNAKYFKVITHELSNALCTLRLANIYDLSSVRIHHELSPQSVLISSFEAYLPPEVCQTGPARVLGHRLRFSVPSHQLYQGYSCCPFGFCCEAAQIPEDAKSYCGFPGW